MLGIKEEGAGLTSDVGLCTTIWADPASAGIIFSIIDIGSYVEAMRALKKQDY